MTVHLITELPEAFKQLQRVLHQRPGGDREMVEILALVLRHDEQAVITAVELALEAGAPCKPHVLNRLVAKCKLLFYVRKVRLTRVSAKCA